MSGCITVSRVVVASVLLCAVAVTPARGDAPPPPPPDYYLFTFQDLPLDYSFSSTRQAYADVGGTGRGITITAVPPVVGYPRVVLQSGSVSQHVLRNGGTSEFGSEFVDLEVNLLGFKAGSASVEVGLAGTDAYPVTAELLAYQADESGGYVKLDASDTVDLGVGPTSVQHDLEVEAPAGQAIDRLLIRYTYTQNMTSDGGNGNAQQPELIDDLYLRVMQDEPPPPPADTTAPVIHLLQPQGGRTVDDGWITGYVVEDRGLARLTAESSPAGASTSLAQRYAIVDGEERYVFVGRVPVLAGANLFRVEATDFAGNVGTSSVVVTYQSPSYHPPPPEYPADLDFVATGIEVTQSIQRWQKLNLNINAPVYTEDELPAGKATWVRVYASVHGSPDPILNVNCALHAYGADGVELAGSPIYPTRRVTLRPGDTWTSPREDPDRSFNFLLPAAWTYGHVSLNAVVNEWNSIPEATYDAYNNAHADITFRETDSFCLEVYRIRSENEGNVVPTWPDVSDNLTHLREIFPVTPDNLHVGHAGTYTTDRVLDSGDSEADDESLHDLLRDFRRFLGRYYGLSPDPITTCNHASWLGLTAVPHRGTSRSNKQVALSVADDLDYYQMKTAHEIGHTRGLGHVDSYDANCSYVNSDGDHEPFEPYEYYPTYSDPGGTPYFDASIGNWGVLRDLTVPTHGFTLVDPTDTGDVMSYCGDQWISTRILARLYDGFTSMTAAATVADAAAEPLATSVPYLIVSGSIKPWALGELGRLDPVWQTLQPAGSSDHVGKGRYALRLLDVKGAALFTRYFEPEPVANLERFRDFYEVLPAKAGTRSVVLSGGSLPRPVTLTAGSWAPTVRVVYPNGAETWPAVGSRTVYWTSGDLDGDALTYEPVKNSPAPGRRTALPGKMRGTPIRIGSLK